MNIYDWPKCDRPREKLLQFGAHTLSDTELLAIVVNTGIHNKNAVDVARDAMKNFKSPRGIFFASKARFVSNEGLGEGKYAILQATKELYKRSMVEEVKESASFTCAESASEYLRAQLSDNEREVFAMLLLNSQHQLIAYREMFKGTINSAAVYPRELVKQAIADNAAAVILAHNHPSGIAEPSKADIQITQRIKHAFELIDVSVLDHFVIGHADSVSFAQRGLL